MNMGPGILVNEISLVKFLDRGDLMNEGLEDI